MADIYGMEPNAIPGFAEVGGGKFMSVERVPDRTVTKMSAFMRQLRRMYDDDARAFEVCVRHVAAAIEDQRTTEWQKKSEGFQHATPATVTGTESSTQPCCRQRPAVLTASDLMSPRACTAVEAGVPAGDCYRPRRRR
jgi:hypothetical protein